MPTYFQDFARDDAHRTTDREGVLEALAKRCEGASGQDQELDRDMHWVGLMRYIPIADDTFLDPHTGLASTFKVGGAPYYTRSIDTAVMLVPETFYWHLGHGRTRDDEPVGFASIIEPGSLRTISEAEAPTAALALCAAALRARHLRSKGRGVNV